MGLPLEFTVGEAWSGKVAEYSAYQGIILPLI